MGQQDNEIQVKISAETSTLKPGMEASAQDVERASERMRQSVSGLKDAIGGHLSKMTDAVKGASENMGGDFSSLAGSFTKSGAMIGAAISVVTLLAGKLAKAAAETADYTEEAMTLGRAMGITATQASIWMEVAKELGSSTGEVEAASKGLTRQLRENEERLNQLGLVTRDGNGKLKDMDSLMKDGIQTVNSFREGTDRNMAAQEIFGRGVAGNSKLLLANAEAFAEDEAYIRSLGGQVSGEAVEAWGAYDAAMDKVGMGMTAFRNIIGNEVMPVIAKLAEWFSDLMPVAITVVKGAIGGLVSLFWGFKFAVEAVCNGIAYTIESLTVNIMRMVDVAANAFSFDFAAAKAAWQSGSEQLEQIASKRLKNVMDSAEETRKKLWNLFASPTDAEAGNKSGKDFTPKKEKPKKEKTQKVESRMDKWEAELSAQKAAYMETNKLYEMSLADEKRYWDEMLQLTDLNEKERGQIMKKSANLQLQILKKKAQDGRALAQEEVDEWKRSASAGMDIQQQAAEQALALGQISQEEMLQLEKEFERERYEIARHAVEERMALMAKDPNMNPVEYQKLKNQLLEIDRRHALDKKAIENKIQIEKATPSLNVFKTMETSFANAITGMLTRAQTFRQALRGIFSAIANSFITEMVAKPVAEWAMGLLKQTVLYQTFFGTKKAMEVTDAATQMATQKTLGISGVMSNASIAAAAAMASVAAIPFIGWAMAPGVGATTYTTAMAFLPSAEGGWDIPAGATGMMRYHEKEMMLPAKHADVIRGLAENGGSSGSAAQPVIIQALDAKSVRDYLRANSHAIAPALRQVARNFTPAKA